MTTSDSSASLAFIWVWLPGHSDPVVAGAVQVDGAELVFAYGQSYLARHDAISLQPPTTRRSAGLPLVAGTQRPPQGLDAHGVIRDAAPDSWGQQVILRRRVGRVAKDSGELPLMTYLLESGSNRIGALDVQPRSDVYVPRVTHGSLDELVVAGDRLTRGLAYSPELDDALTYGSSVGGARPKALLNDGDKGVIAKFSVSTDAYPWIQAEALGMELARRCGVQVAPTRLIRAAGRDVLLVERFDRPPDGTRRHILSALTLLGLHELAGRHATYTELVDQVRLRFINPEATLQELFRRIVVNVILGNTDDHARNHAAFWNGSHLELTPAYDICPQPRSTGEVFLAMAYGPDGERRARLAACVHAANIYGYTRAQAADLIEECVTTVRTQYPDACNDLGVTAAVRDMLWEREILNPSIRYDT